jgi:hypothetical protein
MKYRKDAGSLPSIIRQDEREMDCLDKDIQNLNIVIDRKQSERRSKQKRRDILCERIKSNRDRLTQQEIDEGVSNYYQGGAYAN